MQKTNLSPILLIVGLMVAASSTFAAPTPPAPDASSSALLLTLGFAGLTAVRKFLRK